MNQTLVTDLRVAVSEEESGSSHAGDDMAEVGISEHVGAPVAMLSDNPCPPGVSCRPFKSAMAQEMSLVPIHRRYHPDRCAVERNRSAIVGAGSSLGQAFVDELVEGETPP